ncbi:Proteasome assembly chaperone 1 [Trinorchestia longiramus]|nr:Proteasome assembly chaperone 1 [Trinorchestia longiramus]
MCTFGDVKFYSSRAFLDDDDDIDDEIEPCVVETLLTEGLQLQPVSALLLAYGGLAVEFGRQLLQRESFSSVGCVAASSHEAPETLAELHTLESTLLVLCPESRTSDSANLLANQVLALCSSDCSCAVLTSQHISKLRAATGDFVDCSEVLRCLTSPSATHLSPSIRRLPQPAFIDSVPAAVVTACTMRSLSCVVYVAYTETISTSDTSAVAPELQRALHSYDGLENTPAGWLQNIQSGGLPINYRRPRVSVFSGHSRLSPVTGCGLPTAVDVRTWFFLYTNLVLYDEPSAGSLAMGRPKLCYRRDVFKVKMKVFHIDASTWEDLAAGRDLCRSVIFNGMRTCWTASGASGTGECVLGRLVSESACKRKDPGSNPAADMVDAARNTAWDLDPTSAATFGASSYSHSEELLQYLSNMLKKTLSGNLPFQKKSQGIFFAILKSTKPDGTLQDPDGTRMDPDGTRMNPNGTRMNPNGTLKNLDGTGKNLAVTALQPIGKRYEFHLWRTFTESHLKIGLAYSIS